jgi:hypothetical protein
VIAGDGKVEVAVVAAQVAVLRKKVAIYTQSGSFALTGTAFGAGVGGVLFGPVAADGADDSDIDVAADPAPASPNSPCRRMR